MRPLVLVLALVACESSSSAPDDSTDDTVDTTPIVTETDEPVVQLPIEQDSSMVLAALTPGRVFALDADLGAVLVFDGNSVEDVVVVGAEPTRLARHRDAWFVTLRASGELVRLEERDGTLVETGRATIGAEPFDVAPSRTSNVVYVSLGQENAVVALDVDTFAELDRWTFEGEPRWLVASDGTGGERVVVAEADAPRVTVIDPSGELPPIVEELDPVRRFGDPDCKPRSMQPLITGAPELVGDDRLYVPAVYLDTQLVEEDHRAWRTEQQIPPQQACEDVGETAEGVLIPCGQMYYGCSPGIEFVLRDGRVDKPSVFGFYNPVVASIDLAGDDDEIINVAGRVPVARGEGDAVSGGDGLAVARGVPSAIAFSPEDSLLFVAMGSQSALVVVDPMRRAPEKNLDFTSYVRGTIPVAAGPAELHLDRREGELLVWSTLDRRLQSVTTSLVAEWLQAVRDPEDPRQIVDELVGSLPAPASSLSAEVQRGRLLFHAADIQLVAQASSGVACANCHPEGRSTPALWHVPDFSRQAPSIVGHVSDTAPFKWTGEVQELWTEIRDTVNLRMGGSISDDDAKAIAAYVDSLRPVVRPAPADAGAVGRGAAVYESACTSCHAGMAHTDGRTHAVGELVLDTPSLRGVAASGPWLHDGSAVTLEATVTPAHADGMTPPAEADVADLVAFLRTL